jgi:YfiH family protein
MVAGNIGLVHAGWRGTRNRIVEAAVSLMQKCASDPTNIVAWVGPMANACCYEVSEELITDFMMAFPDARDEDVNFTTGRHLDLVELNSFQLRRSGVPSESIIRSNFCTIHQRNHFYSYRADNGTHGRIFSMLSRTT